MNRPGLFLDLDGVFADFEGAVFKLFGKPIEHVPRRDMWARVHRTRGFWSNLALLPDADRLWAHCKPYDPTVLTGILKTDRTCIPSKIDWVKRHFGTDRVICCMAWQKPNYGKPGDVLVDDRDKNIQEWEAMGGRGILHRTVDETIAQLKALGFE